MLFLAEHCRYIQKLGVTPNGSVERLVRPVEFCASDVHMVDVGIQPAEHGILRTDYQVPSDLVLCFLILVAACCVVV